MAAERDIGGELYDELGKYTAVQRTPKDISASGDTELIAAQGANKAIRVLALYLKSALAIAVRFKSAGNNLSASYSLGINDDVTLPYNPHGWFQTNANESFAVNQSLAVTSGAQVVWVVV